MKACDIRLIVGLYSPKVVYRIITAYLSKVEDVVIDDAHSGAVDVDVCSGARGLNLIASQSRATASEMGFRDATVRATPLQLVDASLLIEIPGGETTR